jgi:hypothetical protein
VKCAEHREGRDRCTCQFGRNIGRDGEKAEYPNIQLLVCRADSFQFPAIERPQPEIERLTRYGFVDDVRMPLDPIADGGAYEISPIRVKSFLDQQIDLAEFNESEIDCYLL